MYFIGVDIGGTKIAVSIANENCEILDTVFEKTPASPDFSCDRDTIFRCIYQLLNKYRIGTDEIRAIGISCPGPLDLGAGRIVYVATTGWRDIPIKKIFEDEFHTDIYLENDANAAVYSEAKVGAGKGCGVVVYITVSTGIGGGIYIEGKNFHGAHGYSGEFGHICVQRDGPRCSCGGNGCLQLYASGTGLAKNTAERIAAGEPSILSHLDKITALDVEKAVRAGDPLATDVWYDAMERLGMVIASVNQVLDPDVFIFGGGVSKAWDLMSAPILNSAKKYSYASTCGSINLQQAKLGSLIGTSGAILLARDSLQTAGNKA